MSGTSILAIVWCRSHPYQKDTTMADTTADARAAHQLKAYRRHALADNAAPLDTPAETCYRILNNHLEDRQ